MSHITDLTEVTKPSNDDFLVIESPTLGSRKISASKLGGGGLEEEYPIFLLEDSEVLHGEFIEASEYSPYLWQAVYSDLTFQRYVGINGNGKYYVAVDGDYDMRNTCLLQYGALINTSEIRRVRYNISPISAISSQDHTNTLNYSNQQLSIGFIPTFNNTSIGADDSSIINQKKPEIWADPDVQGRYIYSDTFSGEINVPSSRETVVLCITSGIWNLVINSIEFLS